MGFLVFWCILRVMNYSVRYTKWPL